MSIDEAPTYGPIPLWEYDSESRVGYLCVTPSQEIAATKDLRVDPEYGIRLVADYDRYGRILGIEVFGGHDTGRNAQWRQ